MIMHKAEMNRNNLWFLAGVPWHNSFLINNSLSISPVLAHSVCSGNVDCKRQGFHVGPHKHNGTKPEKPQFDDKSVEFCQLLPN